MARARNIKPGFFRNADLAEMPVEARLLFIGLWTIADREGRLEDRPKQIKMEIFPADSFDCNLLLDSLASAGMVDRYEAGGKKYLSVVNFTKHQNPHRDEKASTIPPPVRTSTVSGATTAEHHANTVQTQFEHHANTVAIGLIPDSLIPDSLIPETNTALAASSDVDARAENTAAVAAVRFNAAEFLIEQGADRQTAADYLTLRKGKKAASTHTALRQVAGEVAKSGLDMQTALGMCCARGWAGFKAEWVEQPAIRAGPQRAEKFDPLAYVNRNRTTNLETATVIDITAERLA
jgi:hypothetical protein